MKKFYIPLAIVVGLLIGLIYVTFQPPSTEAVIENTRNAVVLISAEKNKDSKKADGIGTGFFIRTNTIVTNNHVIEDAKTLKIQTDNGPAEYDVKVKWTDPVADIAVLELVDWDKFIAENPDTNYLLATTFYKQGNEVIVIGHPSGLKFSASRGIISQTKQRLGGKPPYYIGSDAHLYPGNSGGPIVDVYGKVVAVSDLMLPTDGGSYGFGIPTAIVKKALADFEKYGEVRWATLGVTLDGNKITELAKDGAGEKAGLKVGDIVHKMIMDDKEIVVQTVSDVLDKLVVSDYQTKVRFIVNNNADIEITPGYRTAKDFAGTK